MVEERHTEEMHQGYSHCLEQQPSVRVRPERSIKEQIDHEAEIKEERGKVSQRETLFQGQVNIATIRGAQVAELVASQQQQLRTYSYTSQT